MWLVWEHVYCTCCAVTSYLITPVRHLIINRPPIINVQYHALLMYAATFYLPHVLLTFAVCPLAGFTHLPHPASISGIELSDNTTSAPVTTSPTSMATSCHTSSHLPFSLAPYTPDWLTGGASADLSLSISMRPVPARVVQQIRAGNFIEMRDLLWDNAALRHHYEEMHGAMGFHIFPVAFHPRVHEVTTLPSWILLLPDISSHQHCGPDNA